jgi:DNA-binding MarR family transcriptional regulator
MLAIWERSRRSGKDLSADLHLGAATLSPLLKRLETLGYVDLHAALSRVIAATDGVRREGRAPAAT